jgi:hypothetical protein
MYTIEEARLSRPNVTYHIPEGATRELDREDINRALETEVKAAHAHRANKFWSTLKLVRQKLAGSEVDRTQSAGTSLPA